jgi:hypothetical protein
LLSYNSRGCMRDIANPQSFAALPSTPATLVANIPRIGTPAGVLPMLCAGSTIQYSSAGGSVNNGLLSTYKGNKFTVGGWFYLPSSQTATLSYFVGNSAIATSIRPTFSGSGAGNTNIQLWASNLANYSLTITTPGAGWHHIIGTYDGTTLIIYLDGISQGTHATTQTIPAATDGAGRWTGDVGAPVDDLAFWNYCMSAPMVKALYVNTQSGYFGMFNRMGSVNFAKSSAIAFPVSNFMFAA